MTPPLGAAVARDGLPFLPGAATASEVMALAEGVGGVAHLRGLAGPPPRPCARAPRRPGGR
jgi:2-keto-3-deoxy-6-phosphogluconate aldolase